VSKKIISSLLIASCGFNSVPVQASPNYSHVEGKEHTREKRISRESSCKAEGKPGDLETERVPYFESVSSKMSVIARIPEITKGKFRRITGKYGYLGLTSAEHKQFIADNEGNILASGATIPDSECAFFKDRDSHRLIPKDQLMLELQKSLNKEIDKLYSSSSIFSDIFEKDKNKKRVSAITDRTYATAEFWPNIMVEDREGHKTIKSDLGYLRLSADEFFAEKNGNLVPYLLGIHDWDKTRFAFCKNGECATFREEPGDKLSQMPAFLTHVMNSIVNDRFDLGTFNVSVDSLSIRELPFPVKKIPTTTSQPSRGSTFGEGEEDFSIPEINLTSLDPYRGYAPKNSTDQTVEAGSSVRRNLNGTVDGRFNAPTLGYLNIADLTPTPYQISGPGNGSGLSGGAIAAITVGVGMGVGIITALGYTYYSLYNKFIKNRTVSTRSKDNKDESGIFLTQVATQD
jgi:hypothetical protein